MAHSLTTNTTGFGKLFSAAAIAATLCASSVATAGVLDFEVDMAGAPFLLNGTHTEFGDYWVETYTTGGEDALVGAVLDSDGCAGNGLSCPTNNSSQYLATLDDGYFYIGLNNGATFQLKSLKASFLGAGQPSFPAVSGVLVLQGFYADDSKAGGAMQLALNGPTDGSFKFADYNLGAFGNTTLDYVRVLGYSCPAVGNCVRNSEWANYAIDDITTVTIPEPASWGLMGLGLLGLAAFSRRRAA